jgi:hypothetical protein
MSVKLREIFFQDKEEKENCRSSIIKLDMR